MATTEPAGFIGDAEGSLGITFFKSVEFNGEIKEV
jgi:hypothetical protein